MWYVYILQSTIRKRFYVGVTQNIEFRLRDHNKGSTKSTKPYRPWKLIYKESYKDKKEAYKREYYLKHPKGYLEKIKIIDKISHPGEVA